MRLHILTFRKHLFLKEIAVPLCLFCRIFCSNHILRRKCEVGLFPSPSKYALIALFITQYELTLYELTQFYKVSNRMNVTECIGHRGTYIINLPHNIQGYV